MRTGRKKERKQKALGADFLGEEVGHRNINLLVGALSTSDVTGLRLISKESHLVMEGGSRDPQWEAVMS